MADAMKEHEQLIYRIIRDLYLWWQAARVPGAVWAVFPEPVDNL